MLRTTLAFFALVPAMALGYAACAPQADTEDREAVMEDEAAVAVPSRDMLGTFRNTRIADVGNPALLVLKSDMTYHRSTPVACVEAECRQVEDDGYYLPWYRGDETFMSLYPKGVDEPDRYQYILRSGSLRLTKIAKVSEREWTTLVKTEGQSWCGVPDDCKLQDLPPGPCAADWYCEKNVCNYSCVPRPPIEDR